MKKNPKFELVDKVVLPRFDNTMDYGSERWVLIIDRDGDTILSTAFSLLIRSEGRPPERGFGPDVYLTTRINKRRNAILRLEHISFVTHSSLRMYAKEIDVAFEFDGITKLFHGKRTLVVG